MIAGARRKGKWTGGPVPFGYSVKDKRLLRRRCPTASLMRPPPPRTLLTAWRASKAARELVEAKLRVEADRLAGAERQLTGIEDDVADLKRAANEVAGSPARFATPARSGAA